MVRSSRAVTFVQCDDPAAGGGLGWADRDGVAVGDALLADHDDAVVEVDIGPAQPGCLAAAQPALGDQPPQRVQPVVGDGPEERDELLDRPYRHRRAFAALAPGGHAVVGPHQGLRPARGGLDHASLDTLAFAVQRLASEPLVLLLAARGTAAPAGFTRDFPELLLPPLSVLEARRLLDAQPHPPRGYAREQVLAQATGNPLALIELSKVIAADPAAGRRWMAEPLPLTDRLTAVMAAQFGVLPPSARAALLLAAVADSPDLTARVPGLDADALAPAERAGLIRVDGSGHSSPTHWYGPAC